MKTQRHHARKNIANLSKNSGYWNKLEHNKFIEALYLYNCNWIKIEKHLKNRTYKQICSHAQKFYVKLKSFKDDVDFTSSYIKSLKDIILLINEKESNTNNIGKLLYDISEKLSFGKNIPVHNEIINIHEKSQLNSSELGNENTINSNNVNNSIENNIKINPELKLPESDDLMFIIEDAKKEFDNIFNINIDNKSDLEFLLKMLS